MPTWTKQVLNRNINYIQQIFPSSNLSFPQIPPVPSVAKQWSWVLLHPPLSCFLSAVSPGTSVSTLLISTHSSGYHPPSSWTSTKTSSKSCHLSSMHHMLLKTCLAQELAYKMMYMLPPCGPYEPIFLLIELLALQIKGWKGVAPFITVSPHFPFARFSFHLWYLLV